MDKKRIKQQTSKTRLTDLRSDQNQKGLPVQADLPKNVVFNQLAPFDRYLEPMVRREAPEIVSSDFNMNFDALEHL